MIEDHQGCDLELRPADTDFINNINLSRPTVWSASFAMVRGFACSQCKTDNRATANISPYKPKICYPCGIFLADCQISMGVATC